MEKTISYDSHVFEVDLSKQEAVNNRGFSFLLYKDTKTATYIEFGANGIGTKLGYFSGTWGNLADPFETSHFYKIGVIRKGDNRYDIEADNVAVFQDMPGYSPVSDITQIKFLTSNAVSFLNYVDNVRIRKYSAGEPESSVGPEATQDSI